uniref:calcium-binding protein n=1 Tax=Klebsiella sp. TaxID=576 RepID=UPI0031DC1BBD
MAKHKAGEATLSDWLGATSDITLLVAGYTGNPLLAGVATALGVASFLTSEGGQKMAKSLWDAIQKYGIADPDTGGWLLPPHDFLMEQLFGSSGPSMSNAENQASPIIIDLDGDGIETLSVSSGVFFDHDGNQFAENTGWVAPDDGLLIFDRDGNGQIDSGSELFGNNTLLKNGKLAANGYQALQELDENKDGQLNSNDAIWASLRIWQDGNSNGRVDEGELLSLEEAGVAAIGTGYSTSQYVDVQGNAHRQTGSITHIDGSVGQSTDVWFAANKGYSRYTGDVTLSAEIQALPYIRGFGNMADLHTAMSLNPQLIALVQQFVADPSAAKASGLIEKLLFTWAGVADIAENSRGSYIDARKLAVIETAAGRGYQNTVNGTVNPLSNAAALLQDEYRRFAAYTEACLLTSTLYASDFDFIHLQLDSDLSGLTLNFEAFEVHLNTLMHTDMERYLRVSNVLYAYMEYLPSFADVRVRLGIPEALTFTGSDDVDVVTGKNTNDVLWGGKGNDLLKGGYGDDTYLFNAGDGQDTIFEGSGTDTLRLGEGLLAEQAVVSRQSVQGYDSLVLGFCDRADSVIIQGYFSLDYYQVEQIVFADGTVWDVPAVKAMLLAGTEAAQSLQAFREGSEIHAGGGNDVLTGDNGNDALYGEAGDDTLDGGFGNDLLHGGTGKDTLKGGSGNDIYLFNAGDGQDTIIESGGTDTLRLGEGLLAEQTVLSRQRVQGYDSLVLSFRDRADSVIIQGYFSLDYYQVEQIVFADGTVWDVPAVKAMLLAGTEAAQSLQAYREGSEIHAGGGNDVLTGDNGNDALYGEAGDDNLDGGFGNDLLHGGTGKDTLKGGSGNDIYLFNAGDGQDTIIESGGT